MKELIAHEPYLKSAPSHEVFDASQHENALYPELFTGDSLLELCNSFWKPVPGSKWNIQPFLRGCKWSPDGTCCLSVVNHDGFHITELPHDLYEGCPKRDRMITLMVPVIHVKEPGTVYDFCWYPKMNSHLPETCNWITTKSNSPIQMWDAYNGSLRCSYRGYNSVDEMEPAISAIFSKHGKTIMGGYRNCIRTFNVERPGREFFEHKINSPASCLATNGKLLALGSWNRSIKLFSISEMGSGYKSVGNMYGHTGGITHIQFTPDDMKLVSGGRKDHRLLVWDLRHYRTPLNILKRCVNTNQTIYFDISSCGRYLVSGGTDGVIRVWDEAHIHWTGKLNVEHSNEENATFRFRLHKDSCNSVSIHPSRPILATGSGQYHFVDPIKVLDEESNSTDEENISHQPTGSQMDLNEPTSKLSQENSDTCFTIKEDTKDLILDDKVDVNLMDYIEQQIDKSQNLNLTNEIQCEVHNIASSEVLCTDSQTNDSRHKPEVPLQEQVPSVKPSITLHLKDSIHNHERDTAEEPPCKKFALNTGGERPEAFSLISTNGLKTNTINACIEVPSLEMVVDNKLPFKEVKQNDIESSEIKDVETSISDKVNEENNHTYTDSVCSNLNEDTAERSPSPVQEMKTYEEINETDRNSRIDTVNTNLTVYNVYKSRSPTQDVNSHLNLSKNLVIEENEAENSSFKGSNIVNTKQRPNLGIVNESKDVLKNSNDDEMMYSSYAENYLTFWWITSV